jgi:y4mF family transcriptional regulator
MNKELKLPHAANLLLASRIKPGTSGTALYTALGKHPLVVQGEMLKARQPNLFIPSQNPMPEGKLEPVIAEAVGRARNPLKSIAELGLMVREARKAMKMNQAEFAAHAGVGRRFVSELEGGKPSLEFDKVLACAGAAGVDLLAKKRRA